MLLNTKFVCITTIMLSARPSTTLFLSNKNVISSLNCTFSYFNPLCSIWSFLNHLIWSWTNWSLFLALQWNWIIPPGTTSASVGSSTKYKSIKREFLKNYDGTIVISSPLWYYISSYWFYLFIYYFWQSVPKSCKFVGKTSAMEVYKKTFLFFRFTWLIFYMLAKTDMKHGKTSSCFYFLFCFYSQKIKMTSTFK